MLVTFNVVEDDHRSLAIGELCQRTSQTILQLIRFGWVPERAGVGVDELVCVTDLSPSSQIECGVADDAMQPGSEGLVRAETLQRAMCVQEALLHCVLGILVGKQHGPGHRVRALLVPTHQLSERGRIAGLRSHHVAALLLPGGRNRFGGLHRLGT